MSVDRKSYLTPNTRKLDSKMPNTHNLDLIKNLYEKIEQLLKARIQAYEIKKAEQLTDILPTAPETISNQNRVESLSEIILILNKIAEEQFCFPTKCISLPQVNSNLNDEVPSANTVISEIATMIVNSMQEQKNALEQETSLDQKEKSLVKIVESRKVATPDQDQEIESIEQYKDILTDAPEGRLNENDVDFIGDSGGKGE